MHSAGASIVYWNCEAIASNNLNTAHNARIKVEAPPTALSWSIGRYGAQQHSLSSNKMARITSDCGAVWVPEQHDGPNHLGLCATVLGPPTLGTAGRFGNLPASLSCQPACILRRDTRPYLSRNQSRSRSRSRSLKWHRQSCPRIRR